MHNILFDVPPVLYKYRDFNNDDHKRLLSNQELYFSSVDQFNDPFDGTIPFRYNPEELTEDNIFKKYYQITKRDFPHWTEERIHEHCYEFQRRGLFRDERYLADFEKDVSREIKTRFGIVCLCKEKDNFLLWSHYSNSHTGFCVGFDKLKLLEDTQAQFSHMNYTSNWPTIGLFDSVPETLSKLLGTKSELWEYENEYRLLKIHYARRVLILRKETVVEVILGCKMEYKTKESLIKLIAEVYPHARVFEVNLEKNKFKIRLDLIY
jgi:Protein of unknown function (DUF2971)